MTDIPSEAQLLGEKKSVLIDLWVTEVAVVSQEFGWLILRNQIKLRLCKMPRVTQWSHFLC